MAGPACKNPANQQTPFSMSPLIVEYLLLSPEGMRTFNSQFYESREGIKYNWSLKVTTRASGY